jgi:purine-binding chemotaxis protein CheW
LPSPKTTHKISPISTNRGETDFHLDLSRSPEQVKNILKKRAALLSLEAARPDTSETYLEVIEFILAYERYAIETAFIREVYPLKDITILPGTPSFLLGVINLRGQILPVINLKTFFELPDKGLADLNKVLVVNSDKKELGVLADRIEGISRLALSRLQTSLPTLSGIRAEYTKGITEEHLIVLDIQKILSDKKIIINDSL